MDTVETRLANLENRMTQVHDAVQRIGSEVRRTAGWVSIHDDKSRDLDITVALLKEQSSRLEGSVDQFIRAQHTILEKIGGLESRWTTQLVAVLASAALIAAGTVWTILARQ